MSWRQRAAGIPPSSCFCCCCCCCRFLVRHTCVYVACCSAARCECRHTVRRQDTSYSVCHHGVRTARSLPLLNPVSRIPFNDISLETRRRNIFSSKRWISAAPNTRMRYAKLAVINQYLAISLRQYNRDTVTQKANRKSYVIYLTVLFWQPWVTYPQLPMQKHQILYTLRFPSYLWNGLRQRLEI